MKKLNKKWIILIAVAVLLAAAAYIAWAHTPAEEILPEGNWENVRLYRSGHGDSGWEVSPEALREAMSGKTLWRSSSELFMPDMLFVVTIDSEEWIVFVAEGYTQRARLIRDEAASQQADAWQFDSEMFYPFDINLSLGTGHRSYCDDGSFYNAMKQLYREARDAA